MKSIDKNFVRSENLTPVNRTLAFNFTISDAEIEKYNTINGVFHILKKKKKLKENMSFEISPGFFPTVYASQL